MVKEQDNRGADEATSFTQAIELMEEKLKNLCYCSRDSYNLIIIDLDIVSDG